MAGLVEEIQRDALNPSVAVSTMLRKVKVAAAKLKLAKVEGWVEHELNGYGKAEVPEYRQLRGRPQALDPYRGWIPIMLDSDRQNDLLANVALKQSITSLEDLVVRSTAGFVEMPLPAGVIRALNAGTGAEIGRMSNHLSVTQVQSVVDAVRNQVLDWAIELERAGISGSGFSFNEEEKSRARAGSITYNINSIGTFAGNMGTGNTSGDISVSIDAASQIVETARRVKESLPALEVAGADAPALSKALTAVEQEAAKKAPDGGRLKSLLSDARDALVGAAGNLTAEGAMALIGSALKLLG